MRSYFDKTETEKKMFLRNFRLSFGQFLEKLLVKHSHTKGFKRSADGIARLYRL